MAACEKYIEKMNAYIDGSLPASEISGLLEHMEKCGDCRVRFDALKIVSFEMRHLSVETPKGLHDSIMNHVKANKKPVKFAYARIFASVAAAAAITLFAVKSDVLNLGNTFLFGERPIVTNEEITPKEAGEDVDKDIEASTSENAPSALNDGVPVDPNVPPENVENDAPGKALKPSANEKGGKQNNSEQGQQAPDMQAPTAQEEPINLQPNAENMPAGNAAELKVNAAQQAPLKAAQAESEYREPFNVPKLATDEEFAFYCIATGNGNLPKEFTSDMIVGDEKTGPIYIYLSNTAAAHKKAEELLIKAGFAIERSPGNLPPTNSEMEFGLIVVFKK